MALNFTQQFTQAQKKNPKLTLTEFQKQFQAQSPENKAAYDAAVKKNQQITQANQKRAQDAYIKSGGTLKKGEVYDEYATLRGMAEQRDSGVQNPTPKTTFTAEEANKLRTNANQKALDYQPATQDYNSKSNSQSQFVGIGVSGPKEITQPTSELDFLKEQLSQTQARAAKFQAESKAKAKELGQVSTQVSDFGTQLKEQQQQVQDLISSLNSKQQGLGDHVSSVLQDMADSGFEGNLTAESLKMIQDMAENTPPDQLQQLDQKINQISQAPQPQEQPQPQPQLQQEQQPLELPPTPAQEYQSLKNSGMSSAQILKQNPKLANQVVPDGSIINENTGVNIVQTPLGEAYKTPSGVVIPKDSATGTYNLSALTPDQITKMSFADLMAIDLSTKKTSADMKAYYNAQTLQKMSERNDREYGIAQVQLQSFYNSENNRINESKLKDEQALTLEKMRQDLSKDTSIQQLNESKSKAANMMKAQMDAWGLEGSSVMLSAMVAQSNKFEQEISNVQKSYDINIMQLTMASTQSQMEYTNRITELNQNMQGQKMQLTNDYLNKKDDIDNSVLMSKLEQEDAKNNAYRDYVSQVYSHEQEVQAAAAEAAQKAQEDMWEKQKYYTEQMGVMVSVGSDGSINPLLDEDGNPVQTMEGQKFQWEQDKYATDYDLRLQQFQQDQYEFGIDANLRQQQFEQNVQQFGMNYALAQDKQYFDQNMETAKFNQSDQQFYAQMQGYDIKVDENGDYIGTNKMGEVVNFGNGINVAVPTKSKFEYNVTGSDEVRFNVADGTVLPNGRTQCGQFVNDALFGGPGHVKDSFQDKMTMNNSPGRPVAGGAFFENIPGLWTGHTGIVEKVYPDGSFDIKESNYKKNGQGVGIISSAHIVPGSSRWKTIVENGGFYDPVKGGSSVKKKTAPNAQGGSGDYNKYYEQAKKDGMDDKQAKEFAAAQYKAATGPMTEAQGSAYNALIQANKENKLYTSYMSKVNPEKFANDVNILSRKITDPDAPMSAELVNRYIKDPNTRAAIMSESRWVQAVLRKESGAAISAQEYISIGSQFFPRAGDDPQTLKDKAEARALKEKGLIAQAGPAGQKAFEEEKNSLSTSTTSYTKPQKKKPSFVDFLIGGPNAMARQISALKGYSMPEDQPKDNYYSNF